MQQYGVLIYINWGKILRVCVMKCQICRVIYVNYWVSHGQTIIMGKGKHTFFLLPHEPLYLNNTVCHHPKRILWPFLHLFCKKIMFVAKCFPKKKDNKVINFQFGYFFLASIWIFAIFSSIPFIWHATIWGSGYRLRKNMKNFMS